MAFFDKLNQVAKNIGDKTTDAIEIGKLNSKISAERSAASEALKNIGEFYYGSYVERGEAAPETLEFCQSIKAHYEAIAEAQAEIERIKSEKPAPATAPAAAPSGTCCPACGKINSAGTRFCCECGERLEPPAAPQPSICPACGETVAPGMKFCSGCGHRMEG